MLSSIAQICANLPYSDTSQHMDEQGFLLAESMSAEKDGLVPTSTDIPIDKKIKRYILELGAFPHF